MNVELTFNIYGLTKDEYRVLVYAIETYNDYVNDGTESIIINQIHDKLEKV